MVSAVADQHCATVYWASADKQSQQNATEHTLCDSLLSVSRQVVPAKCHRTHIVRQPTEHQRTSSPSKMPQNTHCATAYRASADKQSQQNATEHTICTNTLNKIMWNFELTVYVHIRWDSWQRLQDHVNIRPVCLSQGLWIIVIIYVVHSCTSWLMLWVVVYIYI
jgi:hypothetical protein